MPKPSPLSRETLDQLYGWVRLHCPCALEQPEFFRGLRAILEAEVAAAASKAREDVLRSVQAPGRH